MHKKISIRTGIKQLLSEYFVRVKFHPVLLGILHIVRFVSLLVVTLDWGKIFGRKIQKLSIKNQEILLGVVLGCQIVGLGIIVWSVRKMMKKMTNRQEEKGMEEGFIEKMVMEIGFHWLSIRRYLVMVPLMELCISDVVQWVKQGQDLIVITDFNQTQLILSVINLTIYLLFTYPASFLQFFNKSCLSSKKSNIVSFTYVLNSQSFLCLIIPVIITTQNLFPESFTSSFVRLMGLLMFLILGYVHPSISLRNNGINEVGTIAVISFLGVEGLMGTVGKQVVSGGDLVMLLIGMIMVGVVVYEMRLKRRICLLTMRNNQANDSGNIMRIWNRTGYLQNLIYFIVNYKGHERQLLGYLLSGVQKQGKGTEATDSWNTQGQSKFMPSNWSGNEPSINEQIINLKFTIIKILSSKSADREKCESEVERLFCQLIYLKLYSYYPIENFTEQSMGKQQLSKVIFESSGVFQLMLQVMMLSRKNYLKSYLYISRNEELQKRAGGGKWWNEVAGRCAAKVVKERMRQQSVTGDKDCLKALQYYQFEVRYEELKEMIVESCKNNQQFWAQSLEDQPNQTKLKELISKNSMISGRIFKLSKQTLKQYPEKSPLILIQLMAVYSEFCLNEKIFDFGSRYNFLAVEYDKRQKERSKKIGERNEVGKRDKEELIGCKYSLASNVGVLRVECKSGNWNIQWANEYFWTRCYSGQGYSAISQTKSLQNMSLLCLVVPEQQDIHKSYLTSFINQNQTLVPAHPRPTVLYHQQTRTFINCSLQFQLLPELTDGLKLLCFIDVEREEEALELIMKKGNVVGWTGRMMEVCGGFQVQETEENGVQRLVRSQEFVQFLRGNVDIIQIEESNENRKNQPRQSSNSKQHMITLNQKSYWIRLINKITPSESVQTAIDFEELYHIALVPVGNELKQSSSSFHMNKMFTGVPSETMNGQFMDIDSRRSMTLHERIPEKENLDIIIKESEKIEEKGFEVIQVEKGYRSIFSIKTPYSILSWRVITIIISLLLAFCMLSNILFLSQRSDLLLSQQQISTNFSCMISDITSTLTAMRQYNYYAYVYSPKHPQISYLVKKLNKQENVISERIKKLAPELRQVWRGFQILPTGKVNQVYDSSYVVISNYMLSSITYLEQLPPTAMTFPILVALQYLLGTTPTAAHLSFLEGIYNGLYVTLPNLLKIRTAHLNRICEQLLSYTSMNQLYSCFFGLACILVFILVSFQIETKSASILSRTSRLFSSSVLSQEIKSRKLKLLMEMKEKLEGNRKSQLISNQVSPNTNCLDYFTKTLKTIHLPAEKMNQSDKEESMTGRELNQGISQSNQFDNPSSQMSKLRIQNTTIKKSEGFNMNKSALSPAIELYPSSLRHKLYSLAFYLSICLPLVGYFVGIVFGSLAINANIVSHIRLTSEVYNRRSYQELTFLLTRQTAYFEPFLKDLVPNWNDKMMEIIEGSYDTDRKVEKMIQDHQDSTQMIKVLNQINNGNLCNYVDRFTNKSEYFNITFTQKECIGVASSILTQGLKQTVVSYLQTSIELFKKYPTPATLSLAQRLAFIEKKEMRNMKYILAYVEQFMEIVIEGTEKDFSDRLRELRTFAIVFSVVSIGCLVVLFYAIKIRWGKLIRERKEIQSMLGLVSLASVKQSAKLRDEFMKISWGFFGA